MSSKQELLPFVHEDGKKWDHYFYDPKTGIIYYERRSLGKRIKFSTGETNPVKAKRIANEKIEEKLGTKRSFVRTLIKEETKAWLTFKESEGWKPDTLNNIRRARKQIDEFWGRRLPNEINRDSFAEWCKWWSENKTVEMENAVKYFNNFCAYLHEKVVNDRPLLPSRLRFKDPNRKKIKAKRERKKERVLRPDEFERIQKCALNPIDTIVTLFMYTHATRIDETLKLDFGRIILDEETPVYRWVSDTNKAERRGEHALHISLIEPLMALREQRRREGTNLLFPQKNDNQKALREQMIDWDAWRNRSALGWHWTPHTFRHTCLTNLFNNSRNPQAAICKLYRVSLGVALETYVKVTKETMLSMRDSIEVKS